MVDVSHAERVVFADVSKTKGDVVAYYERIAARALPHLVGRPLSLKRFPRGLAAAGFFQKNVPSHYPASIDRVPVPRSQEASKRHRDPKARARDVTLYPVLSDEEHLPYLANQGAIELHVDLARVPNLHLPDRFILDLDPPPAAFALVQRAALVVRDVLGELGLATAPMATGSKGYHVVAAITPTVEAEQLALTAHKVASLIAHAHSKELTTAFRIALRGGRVFVDWLRNRPSATAVAPYSLRARASASVATPLSWAELPTTPPDAFSINDVEALRERPDSLAELARAPCDAQRFVNGVDAAFEAAGLELESFDRFRS